MSTLKKLAIVALSVVTIVSTSGAASAVTLSELQGLSRDELLSLLTQLLAGGTTTTTGGTSSVACTFTRNMYPGVSGADVKCLQQYLNGAGYTISTSGAGAPGSESEYYGTKTQAAVKKWQDAMGLSYGSWGGYFGPSSRAKFSQVATGGTTTGGGAVIVVPSGTGLVVQTASDSPAKRTLGTGTAFNPVLKVQFAAGSSDVSITNVVLNKSGFVANTNVSGVDVVDSKNVRHGNVISAVNADNTVNIPFSTPIVVKAGTSETLTFRMNLAGGDYSGTISLSLASVTSNASSVSASFPIAGVAMDVVNGGNSLASTTLDVLTSTGSSTLNIDAASLQEITKFRIQETSSNEAVYLHSMTLYNYGNADDTDYKDVTLEAQDGTVLAVAQPSGQWTVFNLSSNPYKIDKGQTKDFTVKAKLVDGATKTLRLTVYNDYDLDLRGATTGISVIPAAGASVDSSFPIGEGANLQTFGSGSVSLSRASDSPSSSVAPGASGVSLAKFIARPTGESYELRKVSFYIASTGKALTGTVYVKINGATVYSAAASTFTSDSTADTVTLSSYTTLTAATDNTIEIVTDIQSSATSSSSYQVKSFDLVQAKRLITGDIVDPTSSTGIDGYSLSVSSGALAITTLVQPPAGSVVAGTVNYELARFTLNASAGGENVKVSKITITHNGSSTVDTNLGNYKLFVDVDGDGLFSDESAQATTASTDSFTSEDGADDTLAFNLQTQLEVETSKPLTLSLRADVKSGAVTAETHRFNVAESVTAIGKGTGNTVTPTYAGTGQTQTLVGAGQMTLSLLSGSGKSPSTSQVKVVGTDEVVFAFKVTSQYESMKTRALRITATSTTSLTTSTLSNIRLYDGDPASSGKLVDTKQQFDWCNTSYCYVDFTSDVDIFGVGEGGNGPITTTGKEVYVKAKINDLSNLPKWGDNFGFSIAATTHVSSTGVSSASTTITITGTPTASGYTNVAPAYVKIEKVNVPDTTPGTGAGITVARFKVTNMSGSIPVYLSTSTFQFTQNGSATTTMHVTGTSTFKILASAQNGGETDTSGWNSGVGYYAARGTTGASTTISFTTSTNATSGITPTEAKVDANSHRYLTIQTTVVSATNDTYQLAVSALGNILFNVFESDIGLSGNYNGTSGGDVDTTDLITSLYVDGTPVSDMVTAGGS